MRTSLTIDDAVMKKIMEVASLQNRSVAGQMRHMIMTHHEMNPYSSGAYSPKSGPEDTSKWSFPEWFKPIRNGQ